MEEGVVEEGVCCGVLVSFEEVEVVIKYVG